MANEMETHLAAILERMENSVGIIAEGIRILTTVLEHLTARVDALAADVSLLQLQVAALGREQRKRRPKKGG